MITTFTYMFSFVVYLIDFFVPLSKCLYFVN